MTTIINAIYEGGLFGPIGKVELTEGTRVEVRIPEKTNLRDPKAVAAKLGKLAAETPRTQRSESTARDHDQVLYGRKPQP
jgi:predicted DNA-binding antitoxin AbrB/MazE fold protein